MSFQKLLATAVIVLAFVAGPANAEAMNPAPAAPFKGYKAYELKALDVPADLKGSETGVAATSKIQEHLSGIVAPVLAGWTQSAAGEGNGQTLVFEPKVVTLRFISGGKRFWAGALAGDSRVMLSVKITEQPSGRVLGEPQFYQQSNAMAGAWSFGAHDNTMLSRVVELVAGYCKANFDNATGGPTGL